MAQAPRIVRPQAAPVTVAPLAREETSPAFSGAGASSDAALVGELGGIGRFVENVVTRVTTKPQADFDPLDHLPPGDELYAPYYADAQNLEEIGVRQRQLVKIKDARARQAGRGWLHSLGGEVVASALSPSTLIGGPALKGVGVLKGVALGTTALGGANVAVELGIEAGNPLQTRKETEANIAFGMGFGAVIGGIAGAVGRSVTPGKVGEAKAYVEPDVTVTAPRLRGRIGTFVGNARGALKARIRGVESSGDDAAKNPRSSATGRYQFTKGTWKGLGGDWKNRFDPAEQERLMDKLTSQNEAALSRAGAAVDPGNLYLAHFAGSGGAVSALRNLDGAVDGAIQRANPHTRGWTNRQLVAWAHQKMGSKASGTQLRRGPGEEVEDYLDIAEGRRFVREVEEVPGAKPVKVVDGEGQVERVELDVRVPVEDDLPIVRDAELDGNGRPKFTLLSPRRPDGDPADRLLARARGTETPRWVEGRIAALEDKIDRLETRLGQRKGLTGAGKGYRTLLGEQIADARDEILHLEKTGGSERYRNRATRSASSGSAGESVPPGTSSIAPAMQALADKQATKVVDKAVVSREKRIAAIQAVGRYGYQNVTLTELNRFADAVFEDISSTSPTIRFKLPDGVKLTRGNVRAELRARRAQRALADEQAKAALPPERASLEPTADDVMTRSELKTTAQRAIDAIAREEEELIEALQLIRSRKRIVKAGGKEGILVDARLPHQRRKWQTDDVGTPIVDERGLPLRNTAYIPKGSKAGTAHMTEAAIKARLAGIDDRLAWWERQADGNKGRLDVEDDIDTTTWDAEAAEGRLIGEIKAGEPWNDPTRSPAEREALLNRADGKDVGRAAGEDMEWQLANDPARARQQNEALSADQSFDPSREGWEESVERNLAAIERAERDAEMANMADGWDIEEMSKSEIEQMFDDLPQFDPQEGGFNILLSPVRDIAESNNVDPAFVARFKVMEHGPVSARDMADHFAANAKSAFGRMLAAKLAPMLDGVEVRGVNENGWHYGDATPPVEAIDGSAAGMYMWGGADVDSGHIWLTAKHGYNEATFLHEAIHAVLLTRFGSQGKMAGGMSDALFGELEGMRLGMKGALDEMDDDGLRALGIDPSDRFLLSYGVDDLDEFFTMAMSSEPMARFLASYQAGPVTGWQRFVSLVRRALGLKATDETMLDLVLKQGLRVIDHADARFVPDVDMMGQSFASPRRLDESELEGIRVDARAVRDGFRDQSYVTEFGLAADALEDSAEYRNFLVYHKLQTRVAPDMDPEQIVELALSRVEADREQVKISATALERVAVGVLPYGQAERLVPEGSDFMRDFLELGGDYGVMTAANRKGVPSAPGGSVAQRVDIDRNMQRHFTAELRRAYDLYLTGTDKPTQTLTEASILAQRIKRGLQGAGGGDGKMSYAEFGKDMMRAVSGETDGKSPELLKAAAAFTSVMKKVEAEGRRVGYFDVTREIDFEIKRAEKDLAFAERNGLDREVNNLLTRIEELEAQRAAPVMPTAEADYWPRAFNPEAIRRDEAGDKRLRNILESGYRSQRGGNRSAQEAAAAADGAIARLLLEPEGAMVPGIGPAAKHRDLPVSNLEVIDFLVTDPEVLMFKYLQRTMGSIRMIEKYGDPYALDRIDAMRADLLAKGASVEDTERLLQLFEDQRDRIIGAFHGDDPMSMGNRTARGLRNFSSLTTMGSVIYSQVSDVAKAAFTIGNKRLFYSLIDYFKVALGHINKDELLSTMSGHGDELWAMRPRALMMEGDAGSQYIKGTRLENLLARAQVPMFIMNLMGPFTVAMKDMASFGVGDLIMSKAIKVSDTLKAKGEPDAKDVAWLASHGIDAYGAQLLASMPYEQAAPGRLIHPNAKAWAGEAGDRARVLLTTAANGLLGRSIITPGGMDRLAIMDGVLHSRAGRAKQLDVVAELREREASMEAGIQRMYELGSSQRQIENAKEALKELRGELVLARRTVGQKGRTEAPLLSLPLQLKSFGIASAPKTVHALLSGRDRGAAAGVIGMMMAGMFSTYLKAGEAWEFMDKDEILYQSFDNSGLAAWFGDPVEAAVNMAELTRMSEDDDWTDKVGIVGGPAAGMAAMAVEAFGVGKPDDEERLSNIRRITPFGNVLYWKQLYKDLMSIEEAEREGASGGPQPVRGPSVRGGARYPLSVPVDPQKLFTDRAPPVVAQPSQAASLALADWQVRFGKKKKPKKKTRARRERLDPRDYPSALSGAAQ